MKYMQFNDTGYTPCGKWRVVPTEATSEMTSAMVKARMDAEDGGRVLSEADEYGADALIAAAPTPPAEMMLSGEPATWRYQDARGNYRYRKYIPGFDTEYWILKPVALYLHPAPHKGATHCDDCGLTWLDDGLNPLECPYCKQAPNSRTVRDAERYRWLRSGASAYQAQTILNDQPDAIDAAIDAARGAK